MLPGKNGEIQLTDGLRLLGQSSPVFACELTGRRYDVGNKLGYLQANVEFALRREDIGPAFAAYLLELTRRPESGLAEAAAASPNHTPPQTPTPRLARTRR